jgi:hypothetical protein
MLVLRIEIMPHYHRYTCIPVTGIYCLIQPTRHNDLLQISTRSTTDANLNLQSIRRMCTYCLGSRINSLARTRDTDRYRSDLNAIACRFEVLRCNARYAVNGCIDADRGAYH